MLEYLSDAYGDPMFVWFPLVTTAVSMGAFLVFALPFTLMAKADPPRLRQYRLQARRRVDRPIVGRSLGYWLFNNLLLLIGVVAIWPMLRLAGVHMGAWPPWWQIVLLLALFIFVDDFLYYWMHRTLHQGRLYKQIHSVHHRISTPWAVTAHYMHPGEFMATGTLMLLVPLALGVHVGVIWIWVVWRQWEASEGHCGYDLPVSPTRLVPLNDGARFHDTHHAKLRGNYAGFLSYVDGIFGTYSRDYEPPFRTHDGWRGVFAV